MDLLITLIIYIILFAIVAYAGFWIIGRAAMPQPVLWVFGAFLLIALLVFTAKAIQGGLPVIRLT
jgi:hypothetical protein